MVTRGDGGRFLRRALDWLVANGIDRKWIRQQIEPFEPIRWLPVLHRASQRFGDPAYADRIRGLPDLADVTAERTNLLYPVDPPP